VIAAATLDTGALRSSQSSWSRSRRAAPPVPDRRRQSTQLSPRSWYGVRRQAPPGVSRMLSEHHHADNQGGPDFILREGLILSSGLALRSLSTSWLWWPAVAGSRGGTSGTALRRPARCQWRHRAGARPVSHTARRRARRRSRPCRSVTAGVHGSPRGVAPLRHHTASRDTPETVPGRRNGPIAAQAS
jgi:hypothetical protein